MQVLPGRTSHRVAGVHQPACTSCQRLAVTFVFLTFSRSLHSLFQRSRLEWTPLFTSFPEVQDTVTAQSASPCHLWLLLPLFSHKSQLRLIYSRKSESSEFPTLLLSNYKSSKPFYFAKGKASTKRLN